jgi:hypothetical protein
MEKLGFHEWDFDYVLLDFLGDVVCGGFGLPIARDMCQKVIVVGSNDLQSLYVANNVCSAVDGEWGALFAALAENVAEAPPRHPTALTQDQLLGLFSGDEVGRDFVLEPATTEDMCGPQAKAKPSLEVVYDTV